jgi:hypothetical protein
MRAIAAARGMACNVSDEEHALQPPEGSRWNSTKMDHATDLSGNHRMKDGLGWRIDTTGVRVSKQRGRAAILRSHLYLICDILRM